MKVDWPVIALTICLVASVAATVVVVVLKGEGALVGTGLGVLTASLASALMWRVKAKNGS